MVLCIGPTAPSSAASKLMTAANTLKETCSRTVSVSEGSKEKSAKRHQFFLLGQKQQIQRQKLLCFVVCVGCECPANGRSAQEGPGAGPEDGTGVCVPHDWSEECGWESGRRQWRLWGGGDRGRGVDQGEPIRLILHTIYDLSINHRWGDILIVQN